MPLYEYKCQSCDQLFEELVGVNQAFAPKCPECGSDRCERVLSPVSAGVSTTSGGLNPASAAAGCGGSGAFS